MLGYRWGLYTSRRYELAVGDDLRNEGFRVAAQPADFFLTGVSMRQALGQFRVRLRRPDGSLLQAEFVNSNNIESNDTKPLPLPIFPAIRYPFNSLLMFDLANPSTAAPDNITELVFSGYHGVLGAPLPMPSDPAGQLPYDLEVEVTVEPNSNFTVPVRLPFDSNALEVRQLSYANDYSVDDPPFEVYCQLRDDNGVSFFNDWTNINLVFQEDAQSHAGLVNPSIVIPPYGSLRLDLKETNGDGPFHLQFLFRGVLLNGR